MKFLNDFNSQKYDNKQFILELTELWIFIFISLSNDIFA
jgi:hypothetical protein